MQLGQTTRVQVGLAQCNCRIEHGTQSIDQLLYTAQCEHYSAIVCLTSNMVSKCV
jgi:hypothetical protein